MQNRYKDEKQRKVWTVHFCAKSLISTGNELSRCRTDIWSASRKPHVFLTATGLLTLRGIFGNHCFPKKINPDFIILQGGFTVTGFSCVLLCKTAVRYLAVGHLHCGNCKYLSSWNATQDFTGSWMIWNVICGHIETATWQAVSLPSACNVWGSAPQHLP